jgi:hypothetical protein
VLYSNSISNQQSVFSWETLHLDTVQLGGMPSWWNEIFGVDLGSDSFPSNGFETLTETKNLLRDLLTINDSETLS